MKAVFIYKIYHSQKLHILSKILYLENNFNFYRLEYSPTNCEYNTTKSIRNDGYLHEDVA